VITPPLTIFATANGLPAAVRAQVADLLDRRLADAIDLSGQLKQAHWNVKGPQFSALHLLFDAVHGGVEGYVDLLAERVVQVGGVAHGTVRMAAERSELQEYPRETVEGTAHVAALAAVLSQFGTQMRAAIDDMATAGDQGSADICTEISRGTDKWLWMVEAHGQGGPGATSEGVSAVQAIPRDGVPA
jgi:starvation-inducible DNA-binding protein